MAALNLLDIYDFVRRNLGRLALWALTFGLLGFLLCFVLPPKYRASAVILPPEEDELSSALSISRGALGSLASLGRFSSYFTQADVALAILRSRALREGVAEELDLRRVYRTKTEDDTQKRLKKNVLVKQASDGTISVTAIDRDRDRAAKIANSYLARLDQFNREFRSFQARRMRIFLQRRTAQCDTALRGAESALALYQRKKGSIVLPPETRGALEAGSSLMAQKMSAEVELDLLRSYASPQSDEVQRMEARVAELRRQVGELPATQVGGASLLREVAVQQELFLLLTTQLEQSRIREAMDTPTIQVLDPAKPPEKPFWPRRLWMAAFGIVLGIIAGSADAARVVPWNFRRR